jgi:serine/threonine-protein phosphatase 2B catalytic subunit
VKKIDRFKEIPRSGVLCDLMWADPIENADGMCENLCKPNDLRGCSYFFGAEMAKKFLDKNKLISIIRAHEAQV